MIGKSLGPYEIIDMLGAGGMGQVYLAKDTRLGRNVAVKVLPAEFASDPERLARFEQEARAAAALNHPHIAAVFDVGKAVVEGESGDVHYMVQEHLEGQTLGDRLESKGAMSTKTALDLAVEIVEALAAAHGAGIVHRDLKPPNIFVSTDGHGKVLDFGLAKLTEFTGVGGSADSRSPTMVGTVAGQVMGTAGYMAPEQVEGEKIDHRADVFAFGCVLYEMITGRRAFAGKNVLDTLHKIANSEPQPLAEVSDQIPADLQRIVRKCLAKEPSARYQTAGDLVVDLRSLASEVETGTALALGAVSTILPQAAAANAPKKSLGVAVASGVAAGIVMGALAIWFWLGAAPDNVTRFEITLPEGYVLGRGVAVSPDGRDVVFSGTDPDGKTGLFRRSLDDLAPVFITGSDDGQLPLYSPDGEWIVFNESDRLAKIPAEGGEPLELAPIGTNTHASWAPDDTVVSENRGVIYRVSSAGGTPEVLIEGGSDPRYDTPFALADGRHILIGVREGGTWSVGVLDADTGEIKKLVENAEGPGYLPTGHLTFGRAGAVWAQAFDVGTLEVSGTPFPLRSGVSTFQNRPQLTVAPDGTMVYLPGSGGERDALVWLDPSGEITKASEPAPGPITSPRLSPDEQFIAMTVVVDDGGTRVYTYDRRRSTFSLLRGLDESVSTRPVWTPDGEWIYYAAQTEGDWDIYRAPVDRSAPPERFLERPGSQFPNQVSPDGKFLLFRDGGPPDVSVVALDGGEPEPFVAETHVELHATFSPDGRWVAFTSDAAGQFEVYYTPFPGPGRITQISSNGGSAPVWAKDGSRIYYRVSGALMEAEVVPGSDLEFDAPREVVSDRVIPASRRGTNFDSARDGRLLVSNLLLGGPNSERPSLVVVLNWFEVVERLAPKR